MKQEQNKESKSSKKLAGLTVKPGMSRDQIYNNLVSYLSQQGISVVKDKSQEK